MVIFPLLSCYHTTPTCFTPCMGTALLPLSGVSPGLESVYILFAGGSPTQRLALRKIHNRELLSVEGRTLIALRKQGLSLTSGNFPILKARISPQTQLEGPGGLPQALSPQRANSSLQQCLAPSGAFATMSSSKQGWGSAPLMHHSCQEFKAEARGNYHQKTWITWSENLHGPK